MCLAACGEDTAKEAAPALLVKVQVTDVRQQDVPIFKEWVGVTEGMVNAKVRAQVSGYLREQDYREGDRVTKGQLLFRLDDRQIRAAASEAKQNLINAQARHDTSRATLERIEKLYKVDAVSKQILDESRGNERALLADVRATQAALEQATIDLEFTAITSPIDGIAGSATAQIGDLVGPETGPLTTVSTLDPIKVYASLSEREYLAAAKRMNEGQEATPTLQLILADGSTYPHMGRFSFVDRSVDPNTGTIKVATLFPNPDDLLRPGQFGKVRAQVQTRQGALLIPQRAVSEIQGIYQVAVVDAQDTVNIRVVKLGPRVGKDWLVEEGLKPGERVLVEGVQKVRDGMKVATSAYENGDAGNAAAPQQGAQTSGDK